MTSPSKHEFVILGANFAGISTAHYLLRHTIPFLSQLNPSTAYHVTLLSPSTHLFWKIGAPRTLVSPDLIPFAKVFLPIADAFKDYPSDKYTFVKGSAVGLDAQQKIVTVADHDKSISISYSTLVLATGTSSTTALWTLNGSHDNSINAFKDMHKSLPNAKSILIAGGGPAGVETAGEVAALYPGAKTTILSGDARLLRRLKPGTSHDAESYFKRLGVEVVHDVRVTSVKEGKPTELTLSNGTTRTVDVYIDSTGGKPNTSFLPSSWLNERGYVITDETTMRLTTPGTENVYAVGDVASYSHGGIFDVNDAIAPLCSSILVDLASTGVGKMTGSTGLLSHILPAKQVEPKQRYFKPTIGTQIVPIGPKGGVGQLFGVRIPSLMVWGIKSRTFFVEKADGYLRGSDYLKA